MEAHELILGNYVNTNRAHGRGQKQLKKVQINLHYLQQIENNCNYIEPIPLTEEWLLRFGLNRQISVFEIFGDNKRGFHIDLGGEWLFLKHVHQLQNLYFALTGTHLILNK